MSHITFPSHYAFGEDENLGKNLDDAFVIKNVDGYPSIGFHCEVPAGGEITFEGTYDGVNWEAITVRSTTGDKYTKTTTSGNSFVGSISGLLKFRFRTSIAGSANGRAGGNISRGVCVLEGQEFGWPPHRFGFDPVHKDASFSSAQTNTAIWTPAIGKKFVVTDLDVIFGGTTDSRVTIFDENNVTGKRLFNAFIDVSNNRPFPIIRNYKTTFISSAANNVLRITTSHAITIDVVAHGYEI